VRKHFPLLSYLSQRKITHPFLEVCRSFKYLYPHTCTLKGNCCGKWQGEEKQERKGIANGG
jgi:hypothetical protein